jgi:hypothetical protein
LKGHKMNFRKHWWAFLFLAPIALALFIGIGGWVVMSLWNWLLPTLFGWPVVSFWQALGILVLSRILFGGLGSHGPKGSSWRRHKVGHSDHLTPEERERLRQSADPAAPATPAS